MSKGTKISWTTATWNPWMGCTRVAPECKNCYIEFPNMGFGKRNPFEKIYLTQTWRDPYSWEQQLKDTNHAKRIFTCSLSDFFHAKVDARTFGDDDGKALADQIHPHAITGDFP